MKTHKKTLKNKKRNKNHHFIRDKSLNFEKNNSMIEKPNNPTQKQNKKNCKVHVMPASITDDDISALFNGILGVIRRKAELDLRAEILNINLSNERLIKELNEKKSECIRLKNEIIYLKSLIEN